MLTTILLTTNTTLRIVDINTQFCGKLFSRNEIINFKSTEKSLKWLIFIQSFSFAFKLCSEMKLYHWYCYKFSPTNEQGELYTPFLIKSLEGVCAVDIAGSIFSWVSLCPTLPFQLGSRSVCWMIITGSNQSVCPNIITIGEKWTTGICCVLMQHNVMLKLNRIKLSADLSLILGTLKKTRFFF